jgi:hypothetical protein
MACQMHVNIKNFFRKGSKTAAGAPMDLEGGGGGGGHAPSDAGAPMDLEGGGGGGHAPSDAGGGAADRQEFDCHGNSLQVTASAGSMHGISRASKELVGTLSSQVTGGETTHKHIIRRFVTTTVLPALKELEQLGPDPDPDHLPKNVVLHNDVYLLMDGQPTGDVLEFMTVGWLTCLAAHFNAFQSLSHMVATTRHYFTQCAFHSRGTAELSRRAC